MKKVIINADDFGMSLGNTIGILHAHHQGIVTSTTCMINMPYAAFALKEAEKYPNLGVGIHLNMTVGKALTEGKKSFTDDKGYFLNRKLYPDRQPHGGKDELYEEWKAQIEEFIKIAHKKPTHIDSHHHVHLLPWHIDVVKELAKEYDLPIRQTLQADDRYEYIPFTEEWYGFENITVEKMKDIIFNSQGNIEIMCHPALIDQELYDSTSYSLERMKELDVLCQSSLKEWINLQHIKLINYSDLRRIDNESVNGNISK